MHKFHLMATAVLLGALWAPHGEAAEKPSPEPRHQGDVRYLTGGVGDEEQAALRERADEYDFWLTLTRPDGAYLADVDVRIEDDAGKTVLDMSTRGPFLLAELPPGRYAVRARAEEKRAERRIVDVPQQGQVRFYVAMEDRP